MTEPSKPWESPYTATVPEGQYKWYHRDGKEEWFSHEDIEMNEHGWWRPKKYGEQQ